jgi:hypothetical protein
VNADAAVTAALDDHHALSAIVTSADHESVYVGGFRKSPDRRIERHVQWLKRPLRVGDVVTISIVDVPDTEVSAPDRERTYAEMTEEGERARLAILIKKYGLPGRT